MSEPRDNLFSSNGQFDPSTTEEVWELMMNGEDGGMYQGSHQDAAPVTVNGMDAAPVTVNGVEESLLIEQPPAGLSLLDRGDSINSSTVFVNPRDVQTPSGYRYSGTVENQNQQQHQKQQQKQEQQQQQVQQQRPAQPRRVLSERGHQQLQRDLSEHLNLHLNNQLKLHVISGTQHAAGEPILPDFETHSVQSADNNSHGPGEGSVVTTSILEDGNGSHVYFSPTAKPEAVQVQVAATNEGGERGVFKTEKLDRSHNLSGPQSSSDAVWPFPAHQLNKQSHTSPTGVDICTGDYPGHFLFEAKFTQVSSGSTKNKHWDFSRPLKKLFIDINRWVQVEFRVGPNPPPQLRIRALPVYGDASNLREPVLRCPNHAHPSSQMNKDFPHINHLIRFQNEDTEYEEDSVSGRLSTVFNISPPHQGTDYCARLMKFMCLGSDVGGINRRPVRVVFTLELENQVVGRKVVDVRICSCPRRDLQQEETRMEQKQEAIKRIAERFANSTTVPPVAPSSGQSNSTTVLMPPPGKKLKMEQSKDTIIMIPVHAEDYKKLNEFAESAWVCRHPDRADTIKETRRRMIHQHNADLIKRIEKKANKPS